MNVIKILDLFSKLPVSVLIILTGLILIAYSVTADFYYSLATASQSGSVIIEQNTNWPAYIAGFVLVGVGIILYVKNLGAYRLKKSFTIFNIKEQKASNRKKHVYHYLDECKKGEEVQFMAITGKSDLLPPEGVGKPLNEYPIPAAISRGVKINGIVYDPLCAEAQFRSSVESTNIEDHPLLERDSKEVSDTLRKRYAAGNVADNHINNLVIKKTSKSIAFSLWLFDDVAILEPYHLGKEPGVSNLCQFTQMIIPRRDKKGKVVQEYLLLREHFRVLWSEGNSEYLWPPK